MMLRLLIILITGLVGGFILEFVFRSIRIKKIVKPKFASLQMYGLTALFLYFLYIINIHIIFKVLLIIVFTTVIELITGFILLKYKNTRLWDYSKQKFNYRGIVCLLFSFFWLIISLSFYYLVLPALLKIAL